MRIGKLVLGLFFCLGAAALAYAQPFVIGGANYVTAGTPEVVNVSFGSFSGQATVNQYSGYVLINVSGTGQSAGTYLNDAFYYQLPNALYDPSYYQLRYNNAPMDTSSSCQLSQTQIDSVPIYDAYKFIVYDVSARMQVTPPYTPAYQSTNTYSIVLPVPGGAPSLLYFGVSDGDFCDNSGAYTITVTQLQVPPPPPPAPTPTPGVSTNMVSGTQWPGGDPFLQRQNEPSMAVSSRNPTHLVAGANDYRTVDLPTVAGAEETGDAWLGFFTSFDAGQTWTSTLVPGYPQDTSMQGMTSPIHGLNAGADPGVRPGPNGMILYNGLAFNRDQSKSSIFIARYVDDNNLEGGNTIRYLDTNVIAQGSTSSNTFLDKPGIAVDIPRGTNTCPITGPSGPTTVPAFNVYVAYTQFTPPGSQNNAQIMFSQSTDCGVTWGTPLQISNSAVPINQGAQIAIDPNTGSVYVFWRIFGNVNSIAGAHVAPGGTSSSPALSININPFDQGTSNVSFRTNAYPAVAIDGNSNLYIAWSDRGAATDARIMLFYGQLSEGIIPGGQIPVDYNNNARGHQIMPAVAFSSGKLTVAWYDFRDDDQFFLYTPTTIPGQYTFVLQPDGTLVFQSQIADPVAPTSLFRHTVDVRAAQIPPPSPGGISISPSVLVSQYAFGSPTPATSNYVIEQLEFDTPNLPLFEGGTAPFVGDYIDVAGPTMISNNNGAWRWNNLPTDPDYTHVVWTDNRNVIPPLDGNWTNYTPVALNGAPSTFDPTKTTPSCNPGQTGMRNQDIYTASLSPGVIMNAMGNAKPLSPTLQREFTVTVQNTMTQTVSYRLTIGTQPPDGVASFLQSGPAVTQLDISIPALSSASRSLYVTSSSASATVPVTAQQITAPNGTIISNGMTSSVMLNPDVSNPNISNPNISNEEIYNPNISNPNISNPNISNPNISNPNISNPNISNLTVATPNISNPNISNPNISNPNISNPNISNPNISNPNISNSALTDANYIVTNNGNTTASFNLQLLQNQQPPSSVTVQVMVSGIYTTPVANACSLTVEAHYVPILNDTQPAFTTAQSLLSGGAPNPNADIFVLAPGQQAMVTIRAYDSSTTDPAQALLNYNPAMAVTPVVVSAGVNTGSNVPSASLAITNTNLPAGTAYSAYSQPLQAIGGSGTGYTWLATAGLPPGLSVTQQGVLQGTPSGAGTFTITFQVTDSLNNTSAKMLNLSIAAIPPTVSLTGPASQVYGTSFPVTPTTNAGDTPTITSSGPCTVSGTNITMTGGSGTCQLTANWPAASGYAPATATLPVTATPANLSVSAIPASVNFGQPIPSFTPSYNGFVLNDSQSVLTGAPSLTTTATQSSLPGTYAIVAAQGTLAAANYAFMFANGTLTINAIAATASLTGPASAVYGTTVQVAPTTNGGNNNSVTITPSGPCTVNGTAITMTAGSGTCQLTANWPASGGYSPATAALNILATPASLMVKANPASMNYGQPLPTFTATYTGLVPGDPQSASLTTTATQSSLPGTYTITAGKGGLSAANYSFTFMNGTLTINAIAPTVSLTGQSPQTYGTTLPVTPLTNGGNNATITASGPCTVNGTNVTMTAGVGLCKLTATWPPIAQYSSGIAMLNVAAAPANLTVSAIPVGIPFGQPIPAFTPSYTGFMLSDTKSVLTGSPSLTTTATPYSPPGNYVIVAAQGTLGAANYTFTFVNGTLTISATGSAPSSGTTCNGAYTGTFNGNIVVSAGQICEFDGGKVSGNLTSSGGIVILVGATVTGNLQITGAATGAGASLQHQVCSSTLQSNLQFQSDNNPLVIGGAQGTGCGPVTINGNLQVLNNSASTSMTYTTVAGDLQAESNKGPVVVTNDTVAGNLQVQSNTASVAVASNTVQGNLQVVSNTGSSTTVITNKVSQTLQCSGNTKISGSGNTAKQKQGQCAAF